MGFVLSSEWDKDGLRPTPNYDAWRITPCTNLKDLDWQGSMEHLLGWAILAPTAHNKQGLEVTANEPEHTLTVWPARTHIGTPSDTKGRQIYIGVGTFSQNLNIALTGYGLPVNSEFVEGIGTHQGLTGVRYDLGSLSAGRLQSTEPFLRMKARRAYRGSYEEGVEINSGLVSKFTDIAAQKDLVLRAVTDRVSIIAMAGAQYAADRYVLLRRDFRQELAHHLVPNDSLETRIMPGATFGLSDESSRKIHAALQSQGQFDGDYAAGFASSDRDAIATASLVGVVSVKQDVPSEWIKAGNTFGAIWLLASENGLGLGVMAAMVESDLHNAGLRTRLGQAKERPTVVFRLGTPTEVYPHSPRVRVTDLLSSAIFPAD